MLSLPIIVTRLLLALVLGGAIGLERETSEHRVGMRTNALVSLGTALFTIISGYGFLDLLNMNHIQLDPSRIASYVLAGIGFLGGGTIVVRKEGTRGLTTAAAIWAVAAIGMACGVGFYWEAVIATALVLFVLLILRLIEQRLLPDQRAVVLRLWLKPDQQASPLLSQIYETCADRGLAVEKLSMRKEGTVERLELRCRYASHTTVFLTLGELRGIEGVQEGEAEVEA